MKLGIIVNVFDGEEFLPFNLPPLRNLAYKIVAVCQEKSWNGFEYSGGTDICKKLQSDGIIDEIIMISPIHGKSFNTEVNKRNAGIEYLKTTDCTHYLLMDCDEFYIPKDFKNAMKHIEDNLYETSVCKMFTYFKDIHYSIGLDSYYVNFINKLRPASDTGKVRLFPFTVDPTRIPRHIAPCCEFNSNILSMHHYSWVRKDEESIFRKVNNSTAPRNIMNNIKKDWDNAKIGYFVKHYNTKLIHSENIFNIKF